MVTDTGLPEKVSRVVLVEPATRTSIGLDSGGSIRDPGTSRSDSRRGPSRHVIDTRMHSPLAYLNEWPSSSYHVDAPSAPGYTTIVIGSSLGSSVYCLTGPIGRIAPART